MVPEIRPLQNSELWPPFHSPKYTVTLRNATGCMHMAWLSWTCKQIGVARLGKILEEKVMLLDDKVRLSDESIGQS